MASVQLRHPIFDLPEASKVVGAVIERLGSNGESSQGLHCNLATSFGKLKGTGAINQMDDHLKVAIAGVASTVSKLVQAMKVNQNESIEWVDVVGAMSQNPLLEPHGDIINRSDKYINANLSCLNLNGSNSWPITREVYAWFTELIRDKEILDDIKMDIETLQSLITKSTVGLMDSRTLIYKNNIEIEVLDIGVLHFPDSQNSFFKAYRIKLQAWANYHNILFVNNNSCGITGTFTCWKYRPRASVIRSMASNIKTKAIKEARTLFA